MDIHNFLNSKSSDNQMQVLGFASILATAAYCVAKKRLPPPNFQFALVNASKSKVVNFRYVFSKFKLPNILSMTKEVINKKIQSGEKVIENAKNDLKNANIEYAQAVGAIKAAKEAYKQIHGNIEKFCLPQYLKSKLSYAKKAIQIANNVIFDAQKRINDLLVDLKKIK